MALAPRRSPTGSRPPRRAATIRRRALRLVRDLDLPAPLDPDVLCERLGSQRGRPVVLRRQPFSPAGVFGLWIGTADADFVFVERDASPEHRRHIVLHEVGHIVFDHGDDEGDETALQELAPALPPAVVRDARRRSAYDSVSEYEAELFASIVGGWAGEMTGSREHEAADGPGSLRAAFDDPWGWR